MKLSYPILLILTIVIMSSCFSEDETTPKPKTYFRIDVPKPSYKVFDSLNTNYSFEYPNYGMVEPVKSKFDSKNWLNINFPTYGCKLYISYKGLSKAVTLDSLINDSYTFLEEHKKFSSGIVERAYVNKDNNTYGYVFEIKGNDVASTYQFYLTDSTKHFLRGALYFDFKPNNDSLAPIITRLTSDLDHLINTFNWK